MEKYYIANGNKKKAKGATPRQNYKTKTDYKTKTATIYKQDFPP